MFLWRISYGEFAFSSREGGAGRHVARGFRNFASSASNSATRASESLTVVHNPAATPISFSRESAFNGASVGSVISALEDSRSQ